MQNLDVISVNLWSILISLCNLLIMFLILKKFLYRPVQNILAQRQSELDEKYDSAQKAQEAAQESERLWDEKLAGAKAQADGILKDAAQKAQKRSDRTIAMAQERADEIIKQAQADAQSEKKKARGEVKREVIDISTLLAEKMLRREINAEDQSRLIDTAIGQMGDDDGADQ